MEWYTECWSRPWDICWLSNLYLKLSGVTYCVMLSLKSTQQLLRALSARHLSLCMGNRSDYLLMLLWEVRAGDLLLLTLFSTSCSLCRRPRIISSEPKSIRSVFSTNTTDCRSIRWEKKCCSLRTNFTWLALGSFGQVCRSFQGFIAYWEDSLQIGSQGGIQRCSQCVSFHTKVREFCHLGINPKIYAKEPTVNTNPSNQSQSTVVPGDTAAPCPYVYRHSGVRTVWHNRVWHCVLQALHKQLNPCNSPALDITGHTKRINMYSHREITRHQSALSNNPFVWYLYVV